MSWCGCLSSLVLGLTVTLAPSAYAQDATEEETVWLELKARILMRVGEAEAKGVPLELAAFRGELRQIDSLVRNYKTSSPDVALAALLFKGSLLQDKIGALEPALQVYGKIIRLPGVDPLFVGEAYVRKASILAKLQRIKDLEALVAECSKLEDLPPGLLDYLKGTLRHARLVVGSPFPQVEAKTFDEKKISVKALSGKHVLVVFFISSFGGQKGATESLEELVAITNWSRGEGYDGLHLLPVSLDQDREKLAKAMLTYQISGTVLFDGKGWETPLAVECGIQAVPSTYLLGPDGSIVAVDLKGDALKQAVDARLGLGKSASNR